MGRHLFTVEKINFSIEHPLICCSYFFWKNKKCDEQQTIALVFPEWLDVIPQQTESQKKGLQVIELVFYRET